MIYHDMEACIQEDWLLEESYRILRPDIQGTPSPSKQSHVIWVGTS